MKLDLAVVAAQTCMAALMQKMYQKGKFAILQYFTALDTRGSGTLTREEFTRALRLFNLAEGVTDGVVNMLISEVETTAGCAGACVVVTCTALRTASSPTK